MFGFFLTASLLGEKQILLITGGIFSIMGVIFCLWMALRIDRAVVRLYPRIVFLELLLGFQYYRNYLKYLGENNPEYSFVVQVENIVMVDDEETWLKTLKCFAENGFSSARRNHWPMYLATVVLSLCYLVTAAVLTLTISFA